MSISFRVIVIVKEGHKNKQVTCNNYAVYSIFFPPSFNPVILLLSCYPVIESFYRFILLSFFIFADGWNLGSNIGNVVFVIPRPIGGGEVEHPFEFFRDS